MNNKSLYVILGGVLIVIVGIVNNMVHFMPDFIAPFVLVIYGLSILYMSR